VGAWAVAVSIISMAEVDFKADPLRQAFLRKGFRMCLACLVLSLECLLSIQIIQWVVYLRCRPWDFQFLESLVSHKFYHPVEVLPRRE